MLSHHHVHPYLTQDIAFLLSLGPGLGLFLLACAGPKFERLLRLRRLRATAALTAAALLAGCGGGGASVAPPPGPPGLNPSSALTTYSVFVGQSGSESAVDVVPLGQTSNLSAAVKAPGAIVVYPDGSQQVADSQGNFDASTSSYALNNVSAIVANPSNEPVVDVYANAGATPANPEQVALNAYASSSSSILDAARQTESSTQSSSGPSLAAITVLASSASIADGRRKLFAVIGQDTNGSLISLSAAKIAWSVTRANGCGAPAGSVKSGTTDAAKALYTAPASGGSQPRCGDLVTATLTSGSVTFTSSGAANFYDPKTSVKLAGILKDASGKPVANALISLYGGSSESANGDLLVLTDANGKFSRLVPSARVLAPIAALTKGVSKLTFQQVSPASIDPAGAGAALASQTWTMGAPVAAVTPKPLPPFAKQVIDASYYGNAAKVKFPFGSPNASGQFTGGSIEAILAAPKANATGSVTSGAFSGYSYKWDASGKVATFTQPGPAAQAEVLTITTGAAQVNGAACPAGAACFSYNAARGTTLLNEGAWSQKIASGSYLVTYVHGQHDSTHQQLGAPVYTDVLTLSQQLGAQTLSFSDQRFNSANKPLGSLTSNRSAASAPQLYTYNALAHAFSYRADGNIVTVDYSLSSGVMNQDGSGSYQFAITGSPVKNDIGDVVAWSANAPSQIAATGLVARGTIDSPAFTGLTSGHAASFTVASGGLVTVTIDPSLGGGTLTFHL